MNYLSLDSRDPTVARIVQAAFPGWRGRKISAHLTDSVVFSDTLWSEGCRSTYRVIRLGDGKAAVVPPEQYLRPDKMHRAPFPIPPGYVVVEHSQSGNNAYIYIHGPKANLAPCLPAPAEITDDERTVLSYTRSLKSSYGGIKNYRFHEAHRDTGISSERWEAAKAALIGRKLLNRAGAITVDGRNAVGYVN